MNLNAARALVDLLIANGERGFASNPVAVAEGWDIFDEVLYRLAFIADHTQVHIKLMRVHLGYVFFGEWWETRVEKQLGTVEK